MAYAYLVEQDSVVVKRGRRLLVEQNDTTIAELELHQLDALLIFGRVEITTPALDLLCRHNVETAFLSLNGRLKGQLTPPRPKNIALRLAQYHRFNDPGGRMRRARQIVATKADSAAAVLRRFAYNHKQPAPILRTAAGQISEHAAAVADIDSPQSLMGLEGTIARTYFAAMDNMSLGDIRFPGRTSRPPTDPFNAILSFGYVLLGNELLSLLDAMGFEPYLGFYHEPGRGKPSLALDLIEEFRHPIVDRLCLYVFNNRILTADHFEIDDDPTCTPPTGKHAYRLTRDALRTFLGQYDKWMNRASASRPSPRQIIRQQAERLADDMYGRADYIPYNFEE